MTTTAAPPATVSAEPVVFRGRYSTATLYCADCLTLLPIKADAVVSDPPYGIGFARQPTTGGRWRGDVPASWDDVPADLSTMLPCAPIVAIWGGNYYPLPLSRGWLVWYKPDAPPSMASAELAWTNRDQNTRLISHSIAATNGERVGHPTQKPLRVMAWTLEQVGVPIGATILDPYMGSGTTGVACARTHRNFIGIEIDPHHFANAAERIRRELEQQLI